MEINHSNVKNLAGGIVSSILNGIEAGTLPVRGKARRIIWEEFVINQLNYWIDNSDPMIGKIDIPEISRVV